MGPGPGQFHLQRFALCAIAEVYSATKISIGWLQVKANRTGSKPAIGFAKLTRDLTGRKQAEAAQQQLDQRLRERQFYRRALIESNIDALMTTDPLGIATDINEQMEARTGCTRDELINTPFRNYFNDPERAAAGIELVLSQNKSGRSTYRPRQLATAALKGIQSVIVQIRNSLASKGTCGRIRESICIS